MIRVKDNSVQIARLTPGMFFGLIIADQVLTRSGSDCVITSGHEYETRHAHTSLHYSGNGVDFRVHDIPPENREEVRREISDNCGVDYDVLHEYIGKDNEHYHMECQPKRR